MNQSRVVEERFWADDTGDDDDELTADVDGCCWRIFTLRLFRLTRLDEDVDDEDAIDDVIK